jgi:hypothetical protein
MQYIKQKTMIKRPKHPCDRNQRFLLEDGGWKLEEDKNKCISSFPNTFRGEFKTILVSSRGSE